MKVLLTAPPAVGKSTVIEAVVKRFTGQCLGVVAHEVLDESGERIGFAAVSSSGQSRQFMFATTTPTPDSVAGLFDVDVSAIDDFVLPALEQATSTADVLVYIDEIGRAQAKSKKFLSAMRSLLNSDKNVLGTIVYEDEPWSLEFKKLPLICCLEVTVNNRNVLPNILLAAFNHADDFSKLSSLQQELAYGLWRKLLVTEQFTACEKLFLNAVPYVMGNRISQENSQGAVRRFRINGKTNEHSLVWDQKTSEFICDCDLANGRGAFSQKETCSHQMAVLLAHASCRSM